MRTLLVVASVITLALTLTVSAGATPPQHGTVTTRNQFIDTETCGFPIVGDYTFTNDNVVLLDAAGTTTGVEIHQTTVGTLTANGVTLREHDQENVHIDYVAGDPVRSTHVGTFFHIVAPDGTLFLVAGQLVFEVVNGFDGPLIAVHGVDFSGDVATFCAAFT
jgi:hypothetical protein